MSTIRIYPKKSMQGEIYIPGDKSISHRSVMFSALAEGQSVFTNFLMSEDCISTIKAFRQMGVEIDIQPHKVVVNGVGLRGLKAPAAELDMGNSGTTTRLLSGILSAQNFESVLIGDESLSSRPMARVVDPLRLMGADIEGRGEKHFAPLKIRGRKLKAVEFTEKKGSAQVKSCMLLAGLFAEGKTVVIEAKSSRDHTERMLKSFGADLTKDGNRIELNPPSKLKSLSYTVPGDISSAAFFMVAASIIPGADLLLKNVGINPTRMGLYEVLIKMGANIELLNKRDEMEPVADIRIRYAGLKAVNISRDVIPSMIDELPIFMVAAAFAEGTSIITEAEELRVKETDRIESMLKGLSALGVDIEGREDGAVINGNPDAVLRGDVSVESFHDHRTAMSLAVAGLRSAADIQILNSECVNISYPDFFEELDRVTE